MRFIMAPRNVLVMYRVVRGVHDAVNSRRSAVFPRRRKEKCRTTPSLYYSAFLVEPRADYQVTSWGDFSLSVFGDGRHESEIPRASGAGRIAHVWDRHNRRRKPKPKRKAGTSALGRQPPRQYGRRA